MMSNEVAGQLNTSAEHMESDTIITGGMTLKRVSLILQTEVNAVWGCRDFSAVGRPYYTLLVVTNRRIARDMVSVFALSEKETERPAYLHSFLWGEDICYLFPYRRERRLVDFVTGQTTTPAVSEQICVNLLLAGMESLLPYPLLFLTFRQGMVHIENDNSVYLTPYLNLTDLDLSISESDCVVACAQIMLDILGASKGKQLKSRRLLSKKVQREAYAHFSEVYHDFNITISSGKKKPLLKRFTEFFSERKDRIFRFILVISVICFIVAIIMLLNYLIFGDFAISKLFGHGLDTIGTEDLTVK
ncbi:MAG: hypothetical protein LBO70_04795 [Clostridiales Family XIII bacterium]|jgi:hypothetical protein|nr:hypothetical protein [Clostridiales Family XIII bacterium]